MLAQRVASHSNPVLLLRAKLNPEDSHHLVDLQDLVNLQDLFDLKDLVDPEDLDLVNFAHRLAALLRPGLVAHRRLGDHEPPTAEGATDLGQGLAQR